MEKKNGHQNNEKRLFHGTNEQTIGHINNSGFNRSYAGKNGKSFNTISIKIILTEVVYINFSLNFSSYSCSIWKRHLLCT